MRQLVVGVSFSSPLSSLSPVSVITLPSPIIPSPSPSPQFLPLQPYFTLPLLLLSVQPHPVVPIHYFLCPPQNIFIGSGERCNLQASPVGFLDRASAAETFLIILSQKIASLAGPSTFDLH